MNDTICGWPRIRIPDACRDVEIEIGIDEAGRGPVLGSLIYGIAFWPVSMAEEIHKIGFNDSKQLNENSREMLFQKMLAHPAIGWVIEELSAATLSKEMLRPSPISLNALSYDAVVHGLEIIRDAKSETELNAVPPVINNIYVDTVGDPEFYKSRLIRCLGEHFGTFTIEKKADATYKVVSAASIVAKVTRDHLMKEWRCDIKFPHSIGKNQEITSDYGSGYPGDPACVKWLQSSMDHEKVFLYPNDITRFAWGTVKDLVKNESAVEVKWLCEDEENGSDAAQTPNLKCYFGSVGEKRPKRSNYFMKKKMKLILPSEI